MQQLDTTKPVYCIGDVHGCFKTLCALIESLPQKWDSQIIFVGDLIDRGTHSCQVVDLVIKNSYACVLGNHEVLMMEYYHAFPKHPLRNENVWFINGGYETIESYMRDGGSAKIHEHLDFFKDLPMSLELDYPDEHGKRLFVTHGFGLPFWNKPPDDPLEICWNRLRKHDYKTLDRKKDYAIFNVFGHDVQREVLLMKNFAAIDTGCVYYQKLENPALSALEWPSKRIFQQSYCG